MKYIAIVTSLSLFVIAYVWQNIEVMQITMEYRAKVRHEKKLIEEVDRYRYLVERRRYEQWILNVTGETDYRPLTPDDVVPISIHSKARGEADGQ